ncbi:MAG: hypothetical protein AAGU76_00245 [Sedimentibacter sp.]|uniref:hypothetical protein n=1 Tax=Sedimentibacter sp. TaxID=1960295 RepID=UPI00315906EE
MKRLFLLLGFISILLAGCNKTNDTNTITNDTVNTTSDTVTITTDRNSYTPVMSSAQGITMSPDFKSEKNYAKLEYHWITNYGEFIGTGKEVKNQGEAVIWSAIEKDKVIDIKDSFDIRLEVIDGESQKILAGTKLTIVPNNGFYEIKH